LFADFANVFDQRMMQKRLDFLFVVFAVARIDLGRDLEGHAGPDRDFDSAVYAFFARDATDKSEVAFLSRSQWISRRGQTVIHVANPVCPGQRLALAHGNGDKRNIAESAMQRSKLRNIQATVQRGHMRYGAPFGKWKMQVIHVKMQYVEFV